MESGSLCSDSVAGFLFLIRPNTENCTRVNLKLAKLPRKSGAVFSNTQCVLYIRQYYSDLHQTSFTMFPFFDQFQIGLTWTHFEWSLVFAEMCVHRHRGAVWLDNVSFQNILLRWCCWLVEGLIGRINRCFPKSAPLFGPPRTAPAGDSLVYKPILDGYAPSNHVSAAPTQPRVSVFILKDFFCFLLRYGVCVRVAGVCVPAVRACWGPWWIG